MRMIVKLSGICSLLACLSAPAFGQSKEGVGYTPGGMRKARKVAKTNTCFKNDRGGYTAVAGNKRTGYYSTRAFGKGKRRRAKAESRARLNQRVQGHRAGSYVFRGRR